MHSPITNNLSNSNNLKRSPVKNSPIYSPPPNSSGKHSDRLSDSRRSARSGRLSASRSCHSLGRSPTKSDIDRRNCLSRSPDRRSAKNMDVITNSPPIRPKSAIPSIRPSRARSVTSLHNEVSSEIAATDVPGLYNPDKQVMKQRVDAALEKSREARRRSIEKNATVAARREKVGNQNFISIYWIYNVFPTKFVNLSFHF